jgi:hypothetical protein
MSDREHSAAKVGPAMTQGVVEVAGSFPSDAALEEAVSQLTLAGFDRADLSMPTRDGKTPETAAVPVTSDVDRRQARTMATSMAAAAGAMAAAGVTVATGGAAAPVLLAAVAGGGVAAAASNAVGQGAEGLTQESHRAAAEHGQLILTVRVRDEAQRARAISVMQAAGATDVGASHRTA